MRKCCGQSKEYWIEYSRVNPGVKFMYVEAGKSYCIESGSCYAIKKEKETILVEFDTCK